MADAPRPRLVVTAGPTISHDEVLELLPQADVRPPVAAGQVLEWGLGPGDVLVVIDGYFLQSRAVRHKELMALLDAGATVIGASSMGALRAAELAAHGMLGVGSVYRAYHRGLIQADDEVTLLHADEDGDHRALGWALVDLRAAARAAAERGVITPDEERHLVEGAASMPFTARRHDAVLAKARELGADPDRLRDFRLMCRRQPRWAKHHDARRALLVARRIASLRTSRSAPAAEPATRRTEPFHTTSYLHAWRPVYEDPTGRHWNAHDIAAWAATASAGFPDTFRVIAAECLLLESLGLPADTALPEARGAIAESTGLTDAGTGLLSWPGLVAALHPALPRLGLHDLATQVREGPGRSLLCPHERELPAPEAQVTLATRLWRADPQYDWQSPTVERLARLGRLPSGPERAYETGDPRLRTALLRLFASWRTTSPSCELLPRLRARGFLDLADLLRAAARGSIAWSAHDDDQNVPGPAPRTPPLENRRTA
ncbi:MULTISPECIES: TfuA-like protein [unclassified Streptomyces]|uniref:TfuA-like protein n=1 Tax=unclassified Streptomyces TaxID=2593676 RepID=UPI002ED6A97E|nr:TfuA-like protein [Streptomyces sp. NBC_00891]WSY07444.1 TfuA-like protein [Streptomyces sp. NBC_00890]WSZ09069.1 TfuA-like protein [Streptomyces sp. NBC_00869]WSZ23432.1 TfuA-like protein [Streptomyces sp. NBC_00870]